MSEQNGNVWMIDGKPSNLEKWRCVSCGATMGFVENKKVLRIKRRDIYLQIEGGKVILNCWNCAKQNFLVDDKVGVVNLQENK